MGNWRAAANPSRRCVASLIRIVAGAESPLRNDTWCAEAAAQYTKQFRALAQSS
jgi:hypothetical protein